jgi:two-component system nitrogen regulation sensor histidine kinase NtrY
LELKAKISTLLRRLHLHSRTNRLALVLAIAAIISGGATYGALKATPPFGDNPNTVIWLLNLDLIILLVLVTLVARRLVKLWSGRKQGKAGSHLHVRLVFIFSLLATVPAILMTIFAAFFLHFGVQGWFSERVATAVNESQAVAEAYLQEHMQIIKADVLAMANDLDRQAPILMVNPDAFQKVMRTQSMLRNLSEAIVFDRSGRILAHSELSYTLSTDAIPPYTMERAGEGDVVVMTGDADDSVRALVKLNNFESAYLYVGRMVDPVVLSHVTDTRQAVSEYEKLEGKRSDLQVKITMIFVVIALLLLFAAIWLGLMFARQMVAPISALISAAERARAGDLTARVPAFNRRDEFDTLGTAFNRMTSQIEEQRDDLIAANRQLDQRRHFIEAVLAGVSAGIVGVDKTGHIMLANASAAEIFQHDENALVSMNIADVMPEIVPLLEQAVARPSSKVTQTQVPYSGKGQSKRILLVRIAVEPAGDSDTGAVLTFDDITELQSAQRKAAWADVARRIAHEIKNPLTPIQLSAERLKKKYLKQISEDPDTFSQCTDTIIHHVGDIGRMVNEFSAFARMPEPVMAPGNLSTLVREIAVLQQQAHPGIKFNVRADAPLPAMFDAQQIRQALTNIIQNAVDSVAADGKKQTINILVSRTDNENFIAVSDSGPGFPHNEDLSRLTEPYVTHKEKGTGLGLAIVKKIMDDHRGALILGVPEWLESMTDWSDAGGATVVLVIPGIEVETQRAIA